MNSGDRDRLTICWDCVLCWPPGDCDSSAAAKVMIINYGIVGPIINNDLIAREEARRPQTEQHFLD